MCTVQQAGRTVHLQWKQPQILFRGRLWRYGGSDRLALPSESRRWLVWSQMRAWGKGLKGHIAAYKQHSWHHG